MYFHLSVGTYHKNGLLAPNRVQVELHPGPSIPTYDVTFNCLLHKTHAFYSSEYSITNLT